MLDTILERIPAPGGDSSAPLQALVTNLDASEYLGRLAIGRVYQGVMRKGENVALLEEEFAEGQPPLKRRLSQLMAYMGVSRVEVDELRAGDLFVVAGFPEVEIGDTIASVETPVALPRLTVDEPVLRMTFGVNTSPFAGRDGKYLTSRHLIDRLRKEILGNVSIKLHETDSADVMEVAGRGELQLAVLIEGMRREGFEMSISRPRVLTKLDEDTGQKMEPLEEVVIDVDEEHSGVVVQKMSERRADLIEMRPSGGDRQRLVFHAPTRGLIGYLGELLTDTRGRVMLRLTLRRSACDPVT